MSRTLNLSITGSGSGAKSDVDYEKLLSKGVRQCLPTTVNHYRGESMQVKSAFYSLSF